MQNDGVDDGCGGLPANRVPPLTRAAESAAPAYSRLNRSRSEWFDWQRGCFSFVSDNGWPRMCVLHVNLLARRVVNQSAHEGANCRVEAPCGAGGVSRLSGCFEKWMNHGRCIPSELPNPPLHVTVEPTSPRTLHREWFKPPAWLSASDQRGGDYDIFVHMETPPLRYRPNSSPGDRSRALWRWAHRG